MESLNQGSLRSILSSTNSVQLTWNHHFLDMAISICRAMSYLHGRNHIHKDLSSSSIFVGLNYRSTKVGWNDVFGFERAHGKPRPCDVYLAPEILSGNSNYDTRSDVYSFGIVLWEMITKESPEQIYSEYQEKMRRNYSFTNNEFVLEFPSEDSSIPEYVEDLFEDCTDGNPYKRPSFEDILRRLEKEKSKLIPKES
ncbi:hypothetical protein THRCLA_04632 [Thraustotheca clavata]|uniref:Protein kinase domain-containing protein n=1 Tax=Thraustotheca clavata TaxID=74557 RepID=A0A1V9ZYG2_9STRA|nr:hypothetical protein THRCLA_04632 [Thraustotheca clavata]